MSGTGEVYVVFAAGGGEFAVPAAAVAGMLWVPELVPAHGWPAYVVGLFQRHDREIPVLDLQRLLGGGATSPALGDIVILVEFSAGCAGILAGEVKRLAYGGQPAASTPRSAAGTRCPVAGEVEVDGDLVPLLDPEAVLPPWEAAPGHPFWPGASERDRDVLRRRAAALRAPQPEGLGLAQFRFAVVRAGSEVFAFELAQIEEFAYRGPMVPVPCTPGHIRGYMNLRGNIVTVVDLLAALALETAAAGGNGKLAIVRHQGRLAGFLLDEVLQLAGMEAGYSPGNGGRTGRSAEWVLGELVVGARVATVVDLMRLLAAEALVVEELVGNGHHSPIAS